MLGKEIDKDFPLPCLSTILNVHVHTLNSHVRRNEGRVRVIKSQSICCSPVIKKYPIIYFSLIYKAVKYRGDVSRKRWWKQLQVRKNFFEVVTCPSCIGPPVLCHSRHHKRNSILHTMWQKWLADMFNIYTFQVLEYFLRGSKIIDMAKWMGSILSVEIICWWFWVALEVMAGRNQNKH